MTEALVHETTRRRLTERQAGLVDQLVDAAEEEVVETGYDGLSVRNVARRAGVASATAYTYFSSKDHLLAELLWRRIRAVPDPGSVASAPLGERLGTAVRDLGKITGGSPDVVAACTQALLSSNPDVKDLRDRIGADIRRRVAVAVGEDGDPSMVGVLVTTYFGALLVAGMGHMDYGTVPEFVVKAAGLMLGPGGTTDGAPRPGGGAGS